MSVRSLVAVSGWFEYLQAYPTISSSRPRLWMCVCARVLTHLHEDEVWMIEMKKFISPVH